MTFRDTCPNFCVAETRA